MQGERRRLTTGLVERHSADFMPKAERLGRVHTVIRAAASPSALTPAALEPQEPDTGTARRHPERSAAPDPFHLHRAEVGIDFDLQLHFRMEERALISVADEALSGNPLAQNAVDGPEIFTSSKDNPHLHRRCPTTRLAADNTFSRLSRVSRVCASTPCTRFRSDIDPETFVRADVPETKSQSPSWTARSKWPTGAANARGLYMIFFTAYSTLRIDCIKRDRTIYSFGTGPPGVARANLSFRTLLPGFPVERAQNSR